MLFFILQELEFHGVVRFYFQDKGEVVTKCIRVSSSASTDEVVSVLVEKFRPDMRMLTNNEYALYEVHVNGGKNCQPLVFYLGICADNKTSLYFEFVV